jgi:hypothetical protein
MSKTTKTSAIVTPVTNPMSMIDSVRTKLQSLKKVSETPYRAEGVKLPNGNYLKSETSIAAIISFVATVNLSETNYNVTAEQVFQMSTFPAFQYQGVSVDAILHDAKLRVAIINQHETEKAYEEVIKQLESVLSEEEKKARVMENCARLLQGITA